MSACFTVAAVLGIAQPFCFLRRTIFLLKDVFCGASDAIIKPSRSGFLLSSFSRLQDQKMRFQGAQVNCKVLISLKKK
jgi:hypothetical protein